MLQVERSAILSTFIKLPIVIKIFFGLFLSGRFTQVLLYILYGVADCKDSTKPELMIILKSFEAYNLA